MTDVQIIDEIREKFANPVGRHLYGILGSYKRLEEFSKKLYNVKTQDDKEFPLPISLNWGIMESIPDDDFKFLVEHEAKWPEPTAAHVKRAFEEYIRSLIKQQDIIILANVELLFAYNLELSILRTLATDEKRIILLLPAKKEAGKIIMFPDLKNNEYTLPTNLIADNHIWQLKD